MFWALLVKSVRFDPGLLMTRLADLARELHLETVYEVLRGLLVRVQDEALVTEAHKLDVLHLKEEAAGERPALGSSKFIFENILPPRKNAWVASVCWLKEHSQVPETKQIGFE